MFSCPRVRIHADWMRAFGLIGLLAAAPAAWGIQANFIPTVSSLDDPAHHLVSPGFGLDAVGQLSIGAGGSAGSCSGTLLSSGMHVLTSAHCVAGAGLTPLVSEITVTFNDANGTQATVTGADKIHLSPLWTGELSDGNDLAVLTLDFSVSGIQGLELASTSDLLGQTVDIYGYGDYGPGGQGAIYPSDGRLRRVSNRYEVLGSDPAMQALGYRLDNLVFYDFDNGTTRFDSFGRFMDLKDTGLPNDQEGSIGLGDSGGPSLLNGRIVGVHSFALQLDGYVRNPSAVGSWGEIAADALVYQSQDWIHSIAHAPEPSTWALMGLGLAASCVVARRRRA